MATKPLSNREIASFCSQMFYLLQAGITPMNGMEILLQDTERNTATHELIEQIFDTCMEGGSFATAIKSTGRFPEYVLSMIALGEESGHLSDIMRSLAEYYEREEEISKSIRDALRYPLIMVGMMILVVLVLIVKVLPIFNQVFSQLGTQMTGFAAQLLRVSDALSRYSVALIIGLAVVIVFMICLSRSKAVKTGFRCFLGLFPFYRRFSDSIASGRFASGMALTLSSGLDTYESLDLIHELVENKTMEKKIDKCKALLQEGNTFADSLKKSAIFSAFYTQMAVIGFKAGSLDAVMQKIAAHYEEDTDDKIRSIISTLEPTLVIVLSLFVGLILLSVILPLMGIMSAIG
ncbi:MAG: type II secretion system F family protein [Lachnospiraceae bacterium]|nr:type II secretion system F family protein [Lachnospiraceae bacterium]